MDGAEGAQAQLPGRVEPLTGGMAVKSQTRVALYYTTPTTSCCRVFIYTRQQKESEGIPAGQKWCEGGLHFFKK